MQALLHSARKSPFLIVTILVLAKMQLFRFILFGGTSPLLFFVDLMSALLITSLIELLAPRRIRFMLYLGFWGVATLTLLGATVYFRYFGSVATYTSLFDLSQLPEVKNSVKSLLKPTEILYVADGIFFAMGWIITGMIRFSRRNIIRYSFRIEPEGFKLPRMAFSCIVVISLLLTVFSVRASTSTSNELMRAELLGFPNYQASVFWQSLKTKTSVVPFLDTTEFAAAKSKLEQHMARTVDPSSEDTTNLAAYTFGKQKGKNLVIVQLEAMQNFVINLSVNGQEVTPVMNDLMRESLYFPNVYQQIGQGNTSDAEFMSNTSIYPTATKAMSKGFGDRVLPSLPKLLKEQGYASMTLHPNDATFWNRDKLYPALDFDHFYAKSSFTNDHFNNFGSSDKELYRVGLEKIKAVSKRGKPFYAQFVSISSHHPFKIPKDKQGMQLPVDIEGTQLGDYLQAIHYSDEALGTLVQGLKDAGLWEHTVFAFYGDHAGLQVDQNEPAEVSQKLGISYDNRVARFNIPFMIHNPGDQAAVIERTGGQVDILPTLANLLGLQVNSDTFLTFGHDLLNIKRNVIGMRYYLPTGSFFNDDILFVPGKGFEDGTAVSLKTHQPVADFSAYKNDYEYVLEWMKLSDEYVNQLPKR
ncbi:MAG: sulfatase-like hydrolase/transferase [Gorillibacterium sp.]|nr:sulfatase-like hydrolase/transferase [Gorillibacterium sp.]